MSGRFDAWVARGDATALGLGIYRILFAALALILVRPPTEWAETYPDALYDPPFGPFRLWDGFPPPAVLDGIGAALYAALALLLVGWRTRATSWAVAVLFVALHGPVYSLGKIDHSILVALVPAVLSFAGWGDRVSVDAARGRVHGIAQWPLRFLALLTGLAFFTAGWAKLDAGWLAPGTHAVQGTLFRQYHVHGRDEWLADWFLGVGSPLFWEPMDVSTVLLECGIVLCVLWWPAWRLALAVAALFHLGVFLMLNIAFAGNLLVYGAFVAWDRLPLPRPRVAPGGRAPALLPPLAAGAGVAAWFAAAPLAPARATAGELVVLAAGAGAAAWLVSLARRGFARPRRAQPAV